MPQHAAVFPGLQFLQVLIRCLRQCHWCHVTELIPRHVIFMGVSLDRFCTAPDTEHQNISKHIKTYQNYQMLTSDPIRSHQIPWQNDTIHIDSHRFTGSCQDLIRPDNPSSPAAPVAAPQKSGIWNPPVQHHIIGIGHQAIVRKAWCHCRRHRHVVRCCFQKQFKHAPSIATGEPNQASWWLCSAPRGKPKICVVALAGQVRCCATDTFQITCEVQVVAHHLRCSALKAHQPMNFDNWN